MDTSTLEALRPAFQVLVLAAIVTALAVRYAQCGREPEQTGDEHTAAGAASSHAESKESRETRDMARISLSLDRARSYSARELGLLVPYKRVRRSSGRGLL